MIIVLTLNRIGKITRRTESPHTISTFINFEKQSRKSILYGIQMSNGTCFFLLNSSSHGFSPPHLVVSILHCSLAEV